MGTGSVFRKIVNRLGWHVLRAIPEYRVYSDLFISPFSRWADWRSGLADADLLLYTLTRSARPRVVVEIGSARGRSTCIFALACRQNGIGAVYAIDPHTTNDWTDIGVKADESYDVLRRRIRSYGFDDICTVIRATSADAAKGWSRPIDLLFIDGDHTYNGVRHDFEAFRPFLTDQALVLFHDSAWDHARDNQYYRNDIGVPRFLSELQAVGYHSVTLPPGLERRPVAVPPPPGLTILDPRKGGYLFSPPPPPVAVAARAADHPPEG